MSVYRKGSKYQKSRTKKVKKPQKIILISQESSEVRVAILENNILEDFFIERTEFLKIYGNIYKGIVKAVVPGIGASFVNLGTAKDGFLYLEEESLSEITEIPDNFFGISLPKKNKKTFNSETIAKNQEVIVQVVKEPIRNKGPRLTRRISIPARYVVMVLGVQMVGISRRIEDQKERDRIKGIFADLKLPENTGFIVRTAGEGQSKKEFIRDLKYLKQRWKQIRTEISKKQSPHLVHQELDLVERIIRDTFTEDTSKIVVDQKALQKKVQKFLKLYLPNFTGGVELVSGKKSIFSKYNVEDEIERTFRRKVPLKCGGHLVIEQTEALVTVDVNSGKFTGDDNLEETAFQTNCEAANEIARQARLRDIGGIIIIDFIDMDTVEHRKAVYRILDDAVKKDRARTNVLQISKLGLVEMTRQRMRPSLESALYSVCPYCKGRGLVRSVVTMSIRTLRELKKTLSGKDKKSVEVKVNPSVAKRIEDFEKVAIKQIERDHRSKVKIIAKPELHIEDISISF